MSPDESQDESQGREAVERHIRRANRSVLLLFLSLPAIIGLGILGDYLGYSWQTLLVVLQISLPLLALCSLIVSLWHRIHAEGLLGDLPDVYEWCRRDPSVHRETARWILARKRLIRTMRKSAIGFAVSCLAAAITVFYPLIFPAHQEVPIMLAFAGFAGLVFFLRLSIAAISFVVVSIRKESR